MGTHVSEQPLVGTMRDWRSGQLVVMITFKLETSQWSVIEPGMGCRTKGIGLLEKTSLHQQDWTKKMMFPWTQLRVFVLESSLSWWEQMIWIEDTLMRASTFDQGQPEGEGPADSRMLRALSLFFLPQVIVFLLTCPAFCGSALTS